MRSCIVGFDGCPHCPISHECGIVARAADTARFGAYFAAQPINGDAVHRVIKRGKGVGTCLLLSKGIGVASTTAIDITEICTS